MGRKIPKQVRITEEQNEWLKRRSGELGVSQSDLIRQAIDLIALPRMSLQRDPKAWEEALQFIKERAKMDVPQTGRTWTRDELYEERLERFSR